MFDYYNLAIKQHNIGLKYCYSTITPHDYVPVQLLTLLVNEVMQSDISTVANLCEVIVSNVRIGLFEFHTTLLVALYPKYVRARV